MAKLSETTERGLQILTEFQGKAAADTARARIESGEIGAAQTLFGIDNSFAGVWDRPGLDRRSRSLVTIGALIAAGPSPEMEHHIKIGMVNGLKPRELEEAITQLLPYIGFAKAGPAMAALKEALKSKGIPLNTPT